jgi:hypothetical protein
MQTRLIIILGYSLTKEGMIHPILKSRLDSALAIYRNTDAILVCGKRPPISVVPMRCEHTTEAEAMKQYLVGEGVSAGTILKEEESATTFGNALFCYLNFLKGAPTTYQNIIIISNEFHERLVRYCFDKVFGNQYPYIFHPVPDAVLDMATDKIEQSKDIMNQLVEKCYPLLFSDVKNGDINAIQSVIGSHKRYAFAMSVKALLCLDESSDIVIASESEITLNSTIANVPGGLSKQKI